MRGNARKYSTIDVSTVSIFIANKQQKNTVGFLQQPPNAGAR